MSLSRISKAFIITWLCLTILAVPFAMAEEPPESFIVFTDKEEYLVGEIVRIYVKAEAIEPNQTITVNTIIVYDPANNTVVEWHDLGIVLNDTETVVYVGCVVAEMEGTYTVYAEGTGCPWILWFIWWFFCRRFLRRNVVPEVPLGTIAALATLVGATGLYIKRRKNNLSSGE